jgi:hypothetical protein
MDEGWKAKMNGKPGGEVGRWALLNVAWAQEQSHFDTRH